MRTDRKWKRVYLLIIKQVQFRNLNIPTKLNYRKLNQPIRLKEISIIAHFKTYALPLRKAMERATTLRTDTEKNKALI